MIAGSGFVDLPFSIGFRISDWRNIWCELIVSVGLARIALNATAGPDNLLFDFPKMTIVCLRPQDSAPGVDAQKSLISEPVKDTKWSRSVDPTVNYVISTARVTVWMQKVPLDLCSAGKLQLDQKLKPAPRK